AFLDHHSRLFFGDPQASEHRAEPAESQTNKCSTIDIQLQQTEGDCESERDYRDQQHGYEDFISKPFRVLRLFRFCRFVVMPAADATASVDPDHHQHKHTSEPVRQHASEDKDRSEYHPEARASAPP